MKKSSAVLGPVPTVDPGDADRHLTAQQEAVLTALRESGGDQPVAAVAAALGLHRNTVREHLDRLVEAGLVERMRAHAPHRGRPAWRYRAHPNAAAAELRAYAGLTRVLVAHLQRTAADPGAEAEALGRAWGREQQGPAGAAAAAGTGEVREQILVNLAESGFAPVDSGAVVALTRCPLLQAARDCPEVICRIHLGLIRGALDALGADGVEPVLTPFAQPGSCSLHLTGRAS